MEATPPCAHTHTHTLTSQLTGAKRKTHVTHNSKLNCEFAIFITSARASRLRNLTELFRSIFWFRRQIIKVWKHFMTQENPVSPNKSQSFSVAMFVQPTPVSVLMTNQKSELFAPRFCVIMKKIYANILSAFHKDGFEHSERRLCIYGHVLPTQLCETEFGIWMKMKASFEDGHCFFATLIRVKKAFKFSGNTPVIRYILMTQTQQNTKERTCNFISATFWILKTWINVQTTIWPQKKEDQHPT